MNKDTYMNFETAASKYVDLRRQVEELERKHKEEKAEIKQKMVLLENWFTAKATEEGLKDIKTDYGTIYWSTHNSATVASREDFFSFCKENDAWDLLESRASKTAVKSYVEAEGTPPPGVNYNTVSVFNFRVNNKKV